MRWSLLPVLLVLLFVPTPGLAQPTGTTDGIGIITDATDDLAARTPAGSQAMGADRNPALDLVGLDVVETADTFDVALRLRSLSDAEAFIVDDTTYLVYMEHNGAAYVVQINRAIADQVYTWGTLLRFDPSQQAATFLRQITVVQEGDALRFSLQRDDLLDVEGAAPFPGRVLENFWAQSNLRTSRGFVNLGNVAGVPLVVGPQADATDVMPDSGFGQTPLPVTIGPQQSGVASLWSPQPMRASNGEATTHVYTMRLTHEGAAETQYLLTTAGAPPAWDVRIPNDLVVISPGATVDIPVLVTTPFSHVHGAVHKFDVTATDQNDGGNVGRTQLGIRFHAVPQPAGHHNEVWLHATRFGDDNPAFVVTDNLFAGNSGNLYLNTLQSDPTDQAVPIKGNYQGYGTHNGFDPAAPEPPTTRWRWAAYLSPDLEMGLDFDLSQTGLLTIPIQAEQPLAQAVADGELLHWSFDAATNQWTRTVAAWLPATAPVDLVPGQPHTFSFPVAPEAAADDLPRKKIQYIGVELNLTSLKPDLFTGAEAPAIMPGGYAQLPLLEYHEPVDEAFASLGAVRLLADEQEKSVHAGKTTAFKATLFNDLDRDATFDLAIHGVGAPWATFPGGDSIRVPAGSNGDILLALTPPAEAKDGANGDLIIEAVARDDSNARALIRFYATVDATAEVVDDAAVLSDNGPAKESPGIAVVTFLAAVAGLAVAARRRA